MELRRWFALRGTSVRITARKGVNACDHKELPAYHQVKGRILAAVDIASI
jgi:hypothetical protein